MNKKYITLVLFFIIKSFVIADDTAELVAEGNKFYKEGKFSEALKKYESAEKNLEDADALILFNKGAAEFGIRRYDKAVTLFEKASLAAKDKELQSAALYNKAVSSFYASEKDKKIQGEEKIKQLGEIASLFRKSFQRDRKLKDAAANLEIVNNRIAAIKKQLEQQKQMQQQQQQQRKDMQDKAKDQLGKQKQLNKETEKREQSEKNKEKQDKNTKDLSEKQQDLQKKSKEMSDKMKSSQDPQQQSASENMKKAEQHQDKAKEKLDKKDFDGAKKEQEKAVKELENAVKKLSQGEKQEGEKKQGQQNQSQQQEKQEGQKNNAQPLDKKDGDQENKELQSLADKILKKEKQNKEQRAILVPGRYKEVEKDW
ncbi:MAG: DUF4175 family protein [Planctomycetota bacterium]|jgi:hypothetical protein